MATEVLKKRSSARNGDCEEAAPENPLARCRPRGDRVVVRRDIARDRSHGGILLPDSFATEKKQTGTVWAVGPGRYENGVLIPIDLKKGERVIITGYAGLEIKDPLNTGSKDDEFVILREEDILAVLGG